MSLSLYRTGNRFIYTMMLVLWVPLGWSCGGEATSNINVPPPGGQDPPLQVESGQFVVTATIQFDNCETVTSHDGTYDIEIDSLGFTMGDDWEGEWSADPTTLSAHGESSHHQQTTPQGCLITRWTEVDLTFHSVDEFSGHIVFRRRTVGTCACCTQCQTSWSVTGVRVTPQP